MVRVSSGRTCSGNKSPHRGLCACVCVCVSVKEKERYVHYACKTLSCTCVQNRNKAEFSWVYVCCKVEWLEVLNKLFFSLHLFSPSQQMHTSVLNSTASELENVYKPKIHPEY